MWTLLHIEGIFWSLFYFSSLTKMSTKGIYSFYSKTERKKQKIVLLLKKKKATAEGKFICWKASSTWLLVIEQNKQN